MKKSPSKHKSLILKVILLLLVILVSYFIIKEVKPKHEKVEVVIEHNQTTQQPAAKFTDPK